MNKKFIEIKKEAICSGFLREFRERTHVGAFEIFIVLASFSKNNRDVQIKIKDFQKATGYSTYKIIRCLKALQKANLIERQNPNIRKKAGIYTIKGMSRIVDSVNKETYEINDL